MGCFFFLTDFVTRANWSVQHGRKTNYSKVVGSERDTEDGSSLSDEEGEHSVEKFMLCSFAHHACSPLLQGSLHEEELCKVVLTCHFSLDVLYLCQEFSDLWSLCTVAAF